MENFHHELKKSLHWYNQWHSYPRHHHAHWALFIIIAALVFSFVSSKVENFYFENDLNVAQASHGPITLGISGDRFTVNGTPQFLLFVTYFSAMDASDTTLESDFSRLQSLGFNGIRIFPNWGLITNYLTDGNGNFRPGMLNRLTNILQRAQNHDLIVDVSFTRDSATFLSFNAALNAVVSTAQSITTYRNLYFDIQNEADHFISVPGDPPRLTAAEARQIRDAVKAVDLQRIVSVSLISNSGGEPGYVINGRMDFHPTHGGLIGPGNGTFITQEKADVPGLPVHHQEPDRCRSSSCTGFGGATYTANDFFTSAREAKCAGAAGYNFHTSAAYNLAAGSMFNQWLDPSVEDAVANGLASQLAGIGWFSCVGGPPPPGPPPPTGPVCPFPTPPPSLPPFGNRGDCPAGYIGLTGANASGADNAFTPGWYCDDDPVDGAVSGVTYPVTGIIMCGPGDNTGVAFAGPGWIWPCNCRPRSGGVCLYDPAQPISASNNPGWEFIGGQPYKQGNPLNDDFYGTHTCSSGGSSPVTIPDGGIHGGAYTSSPSTEGLVCIRGTDISIAPPRYIHFIAPSPAQVGEVMTIYGQNLSSVVRFYNSSGTESIFNGTIDTCLSLVTLNVPNLPPGTYQVRVGTGSSGPYQNDLSDPIEFIIMPGVPPPLITGNEPPVISSIYPITAAQGDIVDIIGEFLTPNVQFIDLDGNTISVTGWASDDNRTTSVIIPLTMLPGVYNVGITGPNGSAVASDVLTVLESEAEATSITGMAIPGATPFQDLITSAYEYSIIVVGIAVFIMILWGGFLWVTSGANPGNIAKAKKVIFNAIFGAILLLSAYVILLTISPDLISGEFTFQGIVAPPPTGPPPSTGPCSSSDPVMICNVTAQNIGTTSATITWTTSVSANSQVLYGPTTSYGDQASNLNEETVHILILSNLTPNVTYNFRAISTCSSCNSGSTYTARSNNYTFRTAATGSIPGRAQAQTLISLLGLGRFSSSADCGNSFHAQQNISDIANNIYPAVCSSRPNPAPPPALVCAGCSNGGPTGTITVDPPILDGLIALWNSGARFSVSSMTTGIHSPSSSHYTGRGVDIVIDGTNSADWIRARDFLNTNWGGNAFCEERDGDVNLSCAPIAPSGVDHIHWTR